MRRLLFLVQLLCVIVPSKDDIAAFKDFQGAVVSPPSGASPRAAAPVPATSTADQSSAPPRPAAPQREGKPEGKVAASPLARSKAAERGIDLAVSGYGFLS